VVESLHFGPSLVRSPGLNVPITNMVPGHLLNDQLLMAALGNVSQLVRLWSGDPHSVFSEIQFAGI